jgi:hypothetical protein
VHFNKLGNGRQLRLDSKRSNGESPLVYTQTRRLTYKLVKWLSIIPACISAALCLFILVTTTWIWSRKHARPTIDRISFRLFWWSMGFELFYDLAFIVGESMVSLLTGLTGLMRRLETLYRELNALWGYTS